ncbi:hypothetical protein, unlikely [Trypanosoma brucei gambiense DAL972]|uniref:Uncharacterized protein n=1 Tax=Trypanosoma brucei gambiense (strain MHOM/CI/86/DAL972) TaxID=679716 RepID=C9ZT85_TRYB9|nr:hypothetical protein, unlikely [Trypanosoma brucei gambiense DAL972]CBH12620.1 hypothetical protein, unlikely [Trypanosoma brucei gambiense DAL972]|eukprot:XP_011774900.1 hypothetical protein, unlikely [Trypanosoma brucei gambiense DAL972]
MWATAGLRSKTHHRNHRRITRAATNRHRRAPGRELVTDRFQCGNNGGVEPRLANLAHGPGCAFLPSITPVPCAQALLLHIQSPNFAPLWKDKLSMRVEMFSQLPVSKSEKLMCPEGPCSRGCWLLEINFQ